MNVRTFFEILRLIPDQDLHPPAVEDDVQLVESEWRRKLPLPLRELYLLCNGCYLVHGNLQILALDEIANFSNQLRTWGWFIPKEVVVFGNNGSDELIGIWMPNTISDIYRCPILEIGEIFEPKCMTIVGTDLIPFITGWLSYYLLLYQDNSLGLDLKGVPKPLRQMEPDDALFSEIRKWADPNLPDVDPDPHQHGLDADELRELFDNPHSR